MGRLGWLVFLLLGGGLGACQGDRTAERWFAPDPQLLEEQTEPSPRPDVVSPEPDIDDRLPAPEPTSEPTPEPSPRPSPRPSRAGELEISEWAEDLVALGTIAADLEPDAPIPRRTFARWLFATYNRFYADRPTQQIRPAAAVSVALFSDVPTTHPDFSMIQGLAEAGVIPSRLSGGTQTLFQPDAPLTRETLIQWKVPLDRRGTLPAGTLAAVRETWGFQDLDQIAPQTFAALLVDYDNGDRANLRRAFGYTTLFQPQRPVTQGEAAAALWFFGFQGEGITAAEAIGLSAPIASPDNPE